MDKFVVTVVPDERAAFGLLQSFDQLDASGSIELHGTCVVTREQDGRIVTRERDDKRELGGALATGLGGLLGLFAGPAGAVVGAAAGAASAFAAESAYTGVAGEYLEQATRALAPGTFAVLAEVEEDWTFPIDDAAAAVGGRVLRQPIGDVIRAQMKAEKDAAEEELAQLDAEIGRAVGEARAKLEARRAAAAAARAELARKHRARIERIEQHLDAQVGAICEKALRTSAAARAHHEAHAERMSKRAAQQKEELRKLFP